MSNMARLKKVVEEVVEKLTPKEEVKEEAKSVCVNCEDSGKQCSVCGHQK